MSNNTTVQQECVYSMPDTVYHQSPMLFRIWERKQWLILFAGDWHFLKNYQEVLLKIYFDAGLSDLARSSGYLPRSLGTNFKRTHRFLLESWEALYRVLMRYFLSKQATSICTLAECSSIRKASERSQKPKRID